MSDDDVKDPPGGKPKRKSTNPKGRTEIPLKLETIEAALRANLGMITRAARKLKVSPDTLRGRIRRSERLQAVRDEVREAAIDLAEDNLVGVLHDPKHKDNYRATEFVLRTLGRERGYGDQMELSLGKGEKRIHLYVPQKDPLPGDDEPGDGGGEDPPAEG